MMRRTATSDPRARRRLLPVMAAVAVVLALSAVAMPIPLPHPAAAQEDLETPTREPEAIRLELVEQDLAFTAGDTIRLVYEVTGDLRAASVQLPRSADDPPALTLQVTNYPPALDPDEIDEVIGADVDRTAFGRAIDGVEFPDARTLIQLDDDGARLVVEIPTDSGDASEPDRLRFDRPGLYPLRLELVLYAFGSAIALTTAGTVVQLLPADGDVGPPLNLALMGAVAEPGPADAERAREETVELTTFAGDVPTPVTLSLPPVTVSELSTDDTAATALRSTLADAELTSRPAIPLDVSSAAAADRVDAFSFQLRAGEDLLTAAAPTTPVRRDVWITKEPLSTAGAQVLRDLGVRYVVMSAQLYEATVGGELPATDRFVDIELPDGGRLPLLVVDELGTELLPGPTDGLSSPEWAIRTATTLLLESGLRDSTTRRSRAVAAPDFGPLDAEKVEALHAVTERTPGIRFTTGSALTGITDTQQSDRIPVTVQLPAEAGPPLSARVELLDATAAALFSAAAMLPEGDPRPARWAEEMDDLVSTAYTDEEVRARVDAMLAEADAVKGAIEPPEPFTFTLTGRRGEIEVPIGNTSDDPLRVKVELSSPKLVFPEGVEEVIAEPGETRLEVPVEARANGTSAVTVRVLSPADEQLAEPVRLTSRVTTFSGVGQVLTGGLILVLLTWWFTHWRQRRRAAAAEVAERHPAGAGSIVRP